MKKKDWMEQLLMLFNSNPHSKSDGAAIQFMNKQQMEDVPELALPKEVSEKLKRTRAPNVPVMGSDELDSQTQATKRHNSL